ncbi:flagellin [Cellulomonas sp. URHD0024]|uniref:flagellin N-terminal helical domain-containing protein n=1 Tax=Cellulomonas sp. URHD0024 TaxID=1302620 RepID=UPI000429AFDB|nr:flagellin [Cellulomonas sp. URHD0024]
MGLSINQNIAAINSYRNLSNTQNDQAKSLEKLSSGFRINRAADDAAGLAISEGLRSQVGGLKVAARNAQDGVSVVQTAEGALTEVHSILQRVRDLAVQGANDSNNVDARKNIDTEATQLVAELDRISGSTNFNGTKLLDGTAGGGSGKLNFQVGADGDANSQITVDLSGANVKAIAANLTTGALAVGGTTFTVDDAGIKAGGAQSFSFTSTTAAGSVSTVKVDLTAAQTAGITNIQDFADKLSGDTNFNSKFSVSVIKDANGAATGVSVKALDGGDVDVTDPDAGGLVTGGTQVANTQAGIDFSSASAAQASITLIDQQIKNVSTARANLGAMQNRFEHTIKNVNVAVENLSASESRIRDTDMASEMVNFTRSQILSQAGTAMLAQANQIPQGVLSLLR